MSTMTQNPEEETNQPNETKEEPVALDRVISVRTKRHRQRKSLIQFGAICISMFLIGWSDGSSGPLLPRMQENYHVGDTVVALIFIANAVGCIVASVSNVYLTQKLGFGKVSVLGAALQTASFFIAAPAPPFPVFVLSFALGGFGLSLQDTQGNGFVAALQENAATKMGIMHAMYGVGALVSPSVSTRFSQIPRWSFYYFVSAGAGFINVALLTFVFRFRTQEQCLDEIGQVAADQSDSEESHYKQILRIKPVYLIALFLFCYVGVEVSMGSWSVTYILRVRHGGSASGYVSTGYFGGLTLGRVALLWVNKKVGETRVVFIYILLAIGLQLVIWLVPSLVLGAVCISLVGFVMGPMYPLAMNHAARTLPPWLLTGSIGVMASLGAVGSALIPFITGAIDARFGIKALQPL
ncbi:major facilitator superfamily domain-containing protein [Mycena floridula]|nr:major facilitator superfamily domain-containing protein [Mycena floridula]